MKSQVFKLNDSGKSQRKIAEILGLSRNTVRGILSHREEAESETPLIPESREWSEQVPWSEIKSELLKPYATIKQLSIEYAPEGIDYNRFWRELKRRVPENLIDQVRIRMRHAAGERFEIDYTDGVHLIDRRTGQLIKTQLFVAISSYRMEKAL